MVGDLRETITAPLHLLKQAISLASFCVANKRTVHKCEKESPDYKLGIEHNVNEPSNSLLQLQ
jgi:hypothetical protein